MLKTGSELIALLHDNSQNAHAAISNPITATYCWSHALEAVRASSETFPSHDQPIRGLPPC